MTKRSWIWLTVVSGALFLIVCHLTILFTTADSNGRDIGILDLAVLGVLCIVSGIIASEKN